MKRKLFTTLFTSLLVLSIFGVNAEANEFENTKKGQLTDKSNYQGDLNVLTPVDNDMSPYADIIYLPGPIKHVGYVNNANLLKLINARKSSQLTFGLVSSVLGVMPSASYAVDATNATVIISQNPLERMQQAYWTNENMYVGQYYSTPTPGLSTIPFIIYSKDPIIFQSPR